MRSSAQTHHAASLTGGAEPRGIPRPLCQREGAHGRCACPRRHHGHVNAAAPRRKHLPDAALYGAGAAARLSAASRVSFCPPPPRVCPPAVVKNSFPGPMRASGHGHGIAAAPTKLGSTPVTGARPVPRSWQTSYAVRVRDPGCRTRPETTAGRGVCSGRLIGRPHVEGTVLAFPAALLSRPAARWSSEWASARPAEGQTRPAGRSYTGGAVRRCGPIAQCPGSADFRSRGGPGRRRDHLVRGGPRPLPGRAAPKRIRPPESFGLGRIRPSESVRLGECGSDRVTVERAALLWAGALRDSDTPMRGAGPARPGPSD